MFINNIQAQGVADSKLVVLFFMLCMIISLSLGILFSITEVADRPSPQKRHPLNHHKILLVNTLCQIFFQYKVNSAFKILMQLLLYQQAALAVNFIYVFTQSYEKNVALTPQEKYICLYFAWVLKSGA